MEKQGRQKRRFRDANKGKPEALAEKEDCKNNKAGAWVEAQVVGICLQELFAERNDHLADDAVQLADYVHYDVAHVPIH